MAKRQKRWARITLDRLRQALGNECNRCGSDGPLEFDCIKPQGHAHHAQSTDYRATFYWRQARAGNLQLLCRDCHQDKSAADQRPALSTDPLETDQVPY